MLPAAIADVLLRHAIFDGAFFSPQLFDAAYAAAIVIILRRHFFAYLRRFSFFAELSLAAADAIITRLCRFHLFCRFFAIDSAEFRYCRHDADLLSAADAATPHCRFRRPPPTPFSP